MAVEAPVPPEESRCPHCGRPPTDESKRNQHLSNLGYVHADTFLECENEHKWVLGIPIGRTEEYGDDLVCQSCNQPEAKSWLRRKWDTFRRTWLGHDTTNYLWVHRVQGFFTDEGKLRYKIHTKCRNCYNYVEIKRDTDSRGIALIGYPHITGQTEGAQSFGYPENEPEWISTQEDEVWVVGEDE